MNSCVCVCVQTDLIVPDYSIHTHTHASIPSFFGVFHDEDAVPPIASHLPTAMKSIDNATASVSCLDRFSLQHQFIYTIHFFFR